MKKVKKYRAWNVLNTKTGKLSVCIARRADGLDLPITNDTIMDVKGIKSFRTQMFASEMKLDK
jgi:hypothetical protein